MITLGQLRAGCPSLSSDQFAALLQLILKYDQIPEDDQPLTAGESLVLWVSDLLEGLKLCSRDTLLVVLQRYHRLLVLHGNAVGNALEAGNVPLPKSLSLGVADRTYLIIDSPDQQYFHLHTQERVPRLEHDPLETIVYNLTALFVNQYRASRTTEAEDQSHGPETERDRPQPTHSRGEPAPHG